MERVGERILYAAIEGISSMIRIAITMAITSSSAMN